MAYTSIEIDELQKRCKKSDPDALYKLGLAYLQGDSVKEDHERGFFLLKNAIWEGNLAACFNVGLCYYRGKGVAKDESLAMFYAEMGAKKGYSNCQFLLATFLIEPQNVSVDRFYRPLNRYSGFCWLEKAAEQGHKSAMFQVALEYEKGGGRPVNTEKAIYWYKKAAEKGDATAMYNLGVLYEGNSFASLQDYNKAGYWFDQAAKNGHKGAVDACKDYTYSFFMGTWKRRQ